ncbi:hypothetical protein SARC_06109 [Sphaeroforma arctica JP610]|uniref:Uncharacterized protein n=1 Tax=Sphaeroforma arctica JP610 TaxID=667725 RepID=A0A0L0G060_9EUKA|nr:hypothetical protein SARC_06109 [Sphaeroforma arctica JP610]KNC81573.1 hypothetical protein SARC_06109 [Sphaeroforma arctica JP610]|eukprot:XP_014155475.1 hypothetical protein SARC_06109 [Sphaeroforma arctica JP610]
MNTGSKVMSGFSSLFLAKIGGQSLFQRVVAQRMDVPSVVAERDALVSKVHDKRLVNVLLDYIKERYPIDGGWKAFADKRKMVGVLIAHVTGDYSGVHAKKSEDVAMAKKKRTVKSLFKKKDKSEAGPVPDEKKQDNPIEGMEHLNVDATMPGINRSNSVNSTVSNTSQKSNRSISPGFKRSDVTVEEIGRVDDWTCGALFQVAVRELERYDLETLVQFSGSDPVTDFLAGLLKVFSSTTTSEKRKMLELDAVLKEFMEAVYTFVHNAAVLDAGPLHETITWLLSSYVHSAEQVDLDEMMESLPSDKERAHVWQEIRSLDQYHKQKNKPQSQQQQQTEGVHTKPLKPALVVTSQLVPEMQKTLAKRLAGQSTAEDQDDLLAAAVQRSSVADLQLGASAAETGDTHEGKVVSHIAVCYDQQGVYALEKHGFAVCNETAEKKDKATYVMCKQATPLHNSILPITDMTVSNSRADETRLKLGGWVRVGKDLSKGSLFGTRINIWYKRGTTQEYSKAISDIQVVQEGQSPPDSSYELVDLNLNKNSIRGKAQHVWFTRKL